MAIATSEKATIHGWLSPLDIKPKWAGLNRLWQDPLTLKRKETLLLGFPAPYLSSSLKASVKPVKFTTIFSSMSLGFRMIVLSTVEVGATSGCVSIVRVRGTPYRVLHRFCTEALSSILRASFVTRMYKYCNLSCIVLMLKLYLRRAVLSRAVKTNNAIILTKIW